MEQSSRPTYPSINMSFLSEKIAILRKAKSLPKEKNPFIAVDRYRYAVTYILLLGTRAISETVREKAIRTMFRNGIQKADPIYGLHHSVTVALMHGAGETGVREIREGLGRIPADVLKKHAKKLDQALGAYVERLAPLLIGDSNSARKLRRKAAVFVEILKTEK